MIAKGRSSDPIVYQFDTPGRLFEHSLQNGKYMNGQVIVKLSYY